MPTIQPARLERFVEDLLGAAGADRHEAQIVAEHLVNANLAGHDSHGVMRTIQYLAEIRTGKIVPGKSANCLEEWESGAVIDATGAFGQVACHEAMQRAIGKAGSATLAAVTIRNCNHSGRLGDYVEMAVQAGMIGLVTANGGGAGQWVAPFGGRERRVSTNPIAFAAPSAGPFPVVLDISTSIVPEGKVRDYLQRGDPVPEGWLVDSQGHPTNDPSQLYANPAGAILSLGGQSGHKGFGLAFMVDVLAGALSAAGCPRAGDFDPAHGSGLFMLAINIERFGAQTEFATRVAEMIDYFKSSEPAAGFDRIMVPGQFEYEQRQLRQQNGIGIPDQVWGEMCALAERFNQEHNKTNIRIPS
jgi:LDH2 family malate/lactate/ureidoglycolate dehydrogenase